MAAEHFDVLIVGAGISGVGAAVHLSQRCKGKSYVILEGRADMGGTWDLFRYPGVRSDSDMHTLGFSFEPWTEAKAIADGPSIHTYVKRTAAKYGVDKHIRFRHRVLSADWSNTDARWTITAENADTGKRITFTCGFLQMCAGYYSYKAGHRPEFPGETDFKGRIVHPQFWPEDLDYRGKRVVVIGSGATAVTLVPAMADSGAAHVTMLQRSPTYMVSRPAGDPVSDRLRAFLPAKAAYGLTRLKNTTMQQMMFNRMRAKPEEAKAMLLKMVRAELPEDYDVETHFTPSYYPWDQRLCLVPDADIFNAIKDGRAAVVTDHIERFTKTGIRLKSGEELPADIIVTATGLTLCTLGEMDFSIDGAPVDFSQSWTYKGMMYSGVPNLISTFGYINASWTLRADLIAEYACRLINLMDKKGATRVVPRLRPEDANMTPRPWIENFSSGYMQRFMHRFPKQGDHAPWTNPQNYSADKRMFRKAPIEDGALVFDDPRGAKAAAPAPVLQAAE